MDAVKNHVSFRVSILGALYFTENSVRLEAHYNLKLLLESKILPESYLSYLPAKEGNIFKLSAGRCCWVNCRGKRHEGMRNELLPSSTFGIKQKKKVSIVK
ncbi:hypothetical protein AVEN_237605-1 [Araneus ventricosus]|uniref:Uncharacterized protein n=1 Tax=Araneus ventricosus TaxID=182803 RepID=A0A4Y2KZZ3_ARAVE|nr:hypothetical protein AVEN_237605-1 [Araneus ventricosus]